MAQELGQGQVSTWARRCRLPLGGKLAAFRTVVTTTVLDATWHHLFVYSHAQLPHQMVSMTCHCNAGRPDDAICAIGGQSLSDRPAFFGMLEHAGRSAVLRCPPTPIEFAGGPLGTAQIVCVIHAH